jgi:CRP/FNR family transcriptional regulator
MAPTNDGAGRDWSPHLQPQRHDDLLSYLDPETVDMVAAVMHEMKVPRNTVLFEMGDEPNGLYRIISGQVMLHRPMVRGEEMADAVLTVFGRGQVFGELSICDPGPRSGTAVTLTPAHLRFIPLADAQRLIATQPTFARTLLSQLGRRLRMAHNATSALVLGDVHGRVARAITQLASRFGQLQSDGSVKVYHGMTQADLAAMVGASREAVNKAMAQFAQRGWVEPRTKGFVVLDYERLLHRAGDPVWERFTPLSPPARDPGAAVMPDPGDVED